MRTGFLCLSAVLLLSCGKAENVPSTSTKAPGPSDETSSPAAAKSVVAARQSTNDSQQLAKATNACMVQDGRPLETLPVRAVGTEPFWGARIEGRCVQYSHMEDQKGTRVWAQYTRNEVGEVWLGMLNGKTFQLQLRSEPGCSDGMSDKRYPMTVELRIGKYLLKGCAEAT